MRPQSTTAAAPDASDQAAAAGEPPATQPFSLCLGGPLFLLLLRTRLSDAALGLLHRRIVAVVLIAWAPLLALSAIEGGLIGPKVAFLADIGFHLRFLAVLPTLMVAEMLVNYRLQPVIEQFIRRDLVAPTHRARFADALTDAARLRNSPVAEFVLVGVVYAVGIIFSLRRYATLGHDAWYLSPGGGVSMAGAWLVFVSLPLFQFLLLRWYFRLFVWTRLLWRISRLKLDLNVTHPDRAGGLGFLSDSLIAFVPIAAAHGLLFTGMIADRIFFAGAQLTDFQVEVFVGAIFLLIVFAGPLLVFGALLARTKRVGLREYGALGQTYVKDFRAKWLSGRPAEEPLVGSGDIQSLADLGNSFATAEQMRFAPIRPTAAVAFVGAFLAPILPLALTMMSPEALLGRVVGLVF